ncbi:MAG: branched-chain amino acid ABC transporter permease [Burkholderiales bacterium]|nr:branched-chain amino acid ABC transporter permease [Burkholderiales bacterium]
MSASDVWLFLQQGILSGMVTGSVYSLLAIAIVIIFKTTDVPNFSQGEIFMGAAYVALLLVVLAQWPYFAVIPITLVVVAAASALFQKVVLQRAAASRAIGVQLVIATLGFAYLLKGLVRRTGLGDTPRSLPAMVPTGSITIGDASLTLLDVAIFGTSVVFMVLLFAMFGYTRMGRAMRAAGMNPRAAQLVGVNLSRIHMLIWALSGLVSAVAALLIAPKLLITPDIAHVAILAFAAAIVGGFTSLPGAVLGGFIIGIAENLVGLFISTNAIVVAPFVAIMVVLIVRPQGILGGKLQVKKV